MNLQLFATLMDVSRRTDKDGAIPNIVEFMEQDNEILQDMHQEECNDGTTHITTHRTGLPEVYYRLYNQGTPPSKSTTAQITDHTAMLEARSYQDVKLVQHHTNPQAYRLSEDVAFFQSINNRWSQSIFYGTYANAKEFAGLTIRYSDPTADNGENILDGGGAGDDNTSIWLVGWGPTTIHGLYPRGSKAGIDHEDKGIVEARDAEGNPFDAYCSKYSFEPGLAVRDWRYAIRIANISVNALQNGGAALADLIRLMIIASEMIPTARAHTRLGWYMHKKVRTALRLQILNKNNVNLTWDTVEGKRVLAFDDIPVRINDALLLTEQRVIFS